MRQRFIQLLTLIVVFVATCVHAAPPKFSLHKAVVPEGWTVVEPESIPECPISVSSEPIALRNEDGTIWIFGSGISESDRDKTTAALEEKHFLEKAGKISGTEFMVYAPKTDRSGYLVWFPTLETYFSISYSIHGHKSAVEFLRWQTPPDVETQEAGVSKAMKAIASMMSEIIGTFPKPPSE